jgi:hypothetical protein
MRQTQQMSDLVQRDGFHIERPRHRANRPRMFLIVEVKVTQIMSNLVHSAMPRMAGLASASILIDTRGIYTDTHVLLGNERLL